MERVVERAAVCGSALHSDHPVALSKSTRKPQQGSGEAPAGSGERTLSGEEDVARRVPTTMHPALIILVVVLTVHVLGLIGRQRIEGAVRPVYMRVVHAKDAATQRRLKKEMYETRQQLNKTSSQDEFAKWARLRRQVDKLVSQLEATSRCCGGGREGAWKERDGRQSSRPEAPPDAHTPFPWCCAPRPDARLAGAASVVSLLVRAALFLATTLFPFCLTFYFGKTPMFYLPPSDSPAAAASASRAAVLPASQKRMAPGGFELPQNPTHAWGMINETYLGPLGWLLSMTAAPRGESSVLRLHLHLRRAQRGACSAQAHAWSGTNKQPC